MAGFFTCGLDQVFIHLCSCLGGEVNYVCNLEKNLAALKETMKELRARRADVLTKVQRQESEGLQRLNEVEVWLTSVENIQNQVYKLLLTRSDELERLCLCGLCAKNLSLSQSYGKRVFEMLKEVEDVQSKGVFEVVAGPPAIAVAVERPLPKTIVGQEKMLERALMHLMDDKTETMGLYGMGGVGKTTLLEQINNYFIEHPVGGVEKVIFVVVSSQLRIEMIQDEIAEKLGFRMEEWKQKEKHRKVTALYTRMKTKKFILLLDDIWKEVDLKEIGVPFPTRANGCKVVFTTRFREVCGQMGVDDPIEVKCLESNEAWDLFRAKVGKITLESHPDILELACQVAGKCQGLPLALNIIGKNMASKRTVEKWEQAVYTLASSASEFPGMKDHIFPILKYSYDSLSEDQKVKLCFEYCALFPEDFAIEKEKLVDYWICEEFIDERQGRKMARIEAYVIIGTLVEACLLTEEGKDKSKVKMHDVVRGMALWVASDFGKDKERCIVKAGVGLPKVPTVENWRSVRRMSLMDNEIENISESPDCPELTTLLFQKNEIENISGKFFKSMPRLVVLDLSHNEFDNGLPEEMSELVSLRYLDLSYTYIMRLPGGLLKLIKLIHLNLEATESLESVSEVSNLSSLRTLRLKDSETLIDLSLVADLELLQHLEVVTIDISSRQVAEKLLSSQRLVKCIQYVKFKNLEAESLTLPTMVSLRELVIMSCGMTEIKIEGTASSSTTCFPNLSSVTIRGCDGLMDLTWLLFAQNVTDLEVGQSKKLKEIISEEKAVNSNIVPFRKLNKLTLIHLEELKSIYWGPLAFPALKEISVTWCPELRKLPLDSESVARVEDLEIYWIPLSLFPKEVYKTFAPLDELQERWDLCSASASHGTLIPMKDEGKGWLEEVEWEDEATRLRFLPCCILQHY